MVLRTLNRTTTSSDPGVAALPRNSGATGSRKPPMPFRDAIAKLRSLSSERGYRLEKAPISGTWFLIDEKSGWKAISDRGTTAFSVKQAIKFLSQRAPGQFRTK